MLAATMPLWSRATCAHKSLAAAPTDDSLRLGPKADNVDRGSAIVEHLDPALCNPHYGLIFTVSGISLLLAGVMALLLH
jgi:hypothetical protein